MKFARYVFLDTRSEGTLRGAANSRAMPLAVRILRATFAFGLLAGAVAPVSAAEKPIGPNTAYASMMRAINPRLQIGQSRLYASALLDDSRAMHLDPALVLALVTVESHWNTHAISVSGAEGLGQIKPETARTLGVDPWSPRSNLRGVTLYLRRLLALFHESREPLREALAGYNAGPYAVKRAGGAAPSFETSRYVAKVMGTWREMRSQLAVRLRRAVSAALALGAARTHETAARPATTDATSGDDGATTSAYARAEASYWGAK